MNTITINYRVSDKRIIAAIAEGKILKKRDSVEIDLDLLTPDQRKDLSVILKANNDTFECPSILDYEGIDGILTEASRVAKLEKDRFEGKRNELISDINNFITGKSKRVLGEGICSDKSGSFDLIRFKKTLIEAKQEYLLDIDEEAIMLLAKKHQDERDEYWLVEREKREIEAAEKIERDEKRRIELETSKNELLAWAKENGSELLKLRIKHEQNWHSIAETEWAIANSFGFTSWDDRDTEKEWPVMNATLEQLHELEASQKENPDHEMEIMRYKFAHSDEECQYGELDPYYFKTFIRAVVKTPTNKEYLYREITDASEE